MTGKKSFLDAGGRAFHMVPCLNDAEPWIEGSRLGRWTIGALIGQGSVGT